MNTPVNGPTAENGSDTRSVAIAKPSAVLCFCGLKTTDAISAAWKNPSADWLTNRMANRRRKSWLRSASRVRANVPFTAAS